MNCRQPSEGEKKWGKSRRGAIRNEPSTLSLAFFLLLHLVQRICSWCVRILGMRFSCNAVSDLSETAVGTIISWNSLKIGVWHWTTAMTLSTFRKCSNACILILCRLPCLHSRSLLIQNDYSRLFVMWVCAMTTSDDIVERCCNEICRKDVFQQEKSSRRFELITHTYLCVHWDTKRDFEFQWRWQEWECFSTWTRHQQQQTTFVFRVIYMTKSSEKFYMWFRTLEDLVILSLAPKMRKHFFCLWIEWGMIMKMTMSLWG